LIEGFFVKGIIAILGVLGGKMICDLKKT